jgi:hypothetical protein
MTWRTVLKKLANLVRARPEKLTKPIPDNAGSLTSVYKTRDLRMDVHQDSKDKNKAIAYILANQDAQDLSVRKFLRSHNKGSGNHKGPDKPVVKIPFNRLNFNVEEFAKMIERCRR